MVHLFSIKYHNNLPIEGILGVAYRDNDKITKIDRPFINNLDKLPIPAYDLIDIKEYQQSDLLYAGRMFEPNKMTIISSRGFTLWILE